MVREELVSLCEQYVRSRDEAAAEQVQPAGDPALEILRSYQLAEISESEMQSLLAYIDDAEDEADSRATRMEAAGISLQSYDGLEAGTDDDDDEPAWQPGQPR
ncbi:MAG: hypothetical protein ACKOWG_05970 [Planctomycetia bacterium]